MNSLSVIKKVYKLRNFYTKDFLWLVSSNNQKNEKQQKMKNEARMKIACKLLSWLAELGGRLVFGSISFK